MLSQELRRNFLNYFKKKGHSIIPSSSVIPHDDPTLLFINAGMNQFKDVFTGKSKRDYSRATSSQKCIRVGGKHNDLDNVGHTSRHLTFFEMLGNFSFGDYFKKEAIAFAWEATLEVFGFDPDKLWISIFEDDDEAYDLWRAHVKPERIIRMGEKDNFWSMGETGPCGPCSELYYDRGEKFGSGPNPKEDPTEERYLEFWNLVFMQYNRDASGKMNPLPNQSIDTGAGIERLVSLKIGVDNVFHTDIMQHIIKRIEKETGCKYDKDDAKLAPAFHVIADHLRSLAFSIADGAQPSNIERGYVLRKLVRRAVRYGRTLLKTEDPFLAKILPALVETMGEDYTEIATSEDRIAEILTVEEESFFRTLKRGGNILGSVVEKAVQNPHRQISGEDAFKLKDTYGFPLEEILLIAKDSNLEVNIDAYQLLEEKAKELSRAARNVEGQEAGTSLYEGFVEKHGKCEFVGHSDPKAQTEILGIVQEGQFVEILAENSEGYVILKKTPFYAEKGGQVGDTGSIFGEKALFRVEDCQNPFPDVIVHKGKLEEGTMRKNDLVTAHIDETRRQNVAAHHTATHLLHYALQKVLGPHISQAGSLVEPNRIRFDFSHHKALTSEEVTEIEDLVNEKVRQNQSVSTYEISLEEAQKRSEIKQFFGDKYGKSVRVVDIDFSKELCGGTHASHLGMVGYFRIIKESSIASGVRRIEATCGRGAEQFVRDEELFLKKCASVAKVKTPQLLEKLSQLLDDNTNLKTQLKKAKKAQLKTVAEELAKGPVIAQVVDVEPEDLADLAEMTLEKLKSGVVALAITIDGRVQLVIKVSPDYVQKGIKAGSLIKEVAPLFGGGGGGKADSAQAGGKNPEGVEEALQKIQTLIQL